jgi:tetratricopeptide (TPR) repeat protein
MPRPLRLILLAGALLGAGLVSWILAASFAPQTAARGSRLVVDREVSDLMQKLSDERLDDQGKHQLLERLLALGRLEEAQRVLHPLLEIEPGSLGLALLMADLRRLNGDRNGARTDLDQLLRLHPDHPDVLKLRVLVEIQDGRTTQALQWLTQRFQNRGPGSRGDLGMLLADLQRQSGDVNAAANLYQQLAEESAGDAKPLLAMAMLRQEQGKAEEVSELLEKARQRRGSQVEPDELIDTLASSWGLTAHRIRAGRSTSFQQAAAQEP